MFCILIADAIGDPDQRADSAGGSFMMQVSAMTVIPGSLVSTMAWYGTVRRSTPAQFPCRSRAEGNEEIWWAQAA
jgi:hypothetical protein